jgi:4-hydroxybenzoate polyprenyltransferase
MPDSRPATALAAWVAERFPVHVSAPVAVVLCGAALPRDAWTGLPRIAATGWLLLFAARAWDDLADLRRDRVRRPERVLPSGRLPERVLRATALGAGALGVAGSFALSVPAGACVAGCAAAGLGWYAARPRWPGLAGPALVNLAFPALVLLGPLGLGAAGREALLLALFAWTAAVAHDLGHGIEEEAGMPDELRDRLAPGVRARWGVAAFLGSLAAAAALEVTGPDPLSAAFAVLAGAVVALRLVPLLRKPTEWNARRLRVAGFVYLVAPLAGRMAWTLVAG